MSITNFTVPVEALFHRTAALVPRTRFFTSTEAPYYTGYNYVIHPLAVLLDIVVVGPGGTGGLSELGLGGGGGAGGQVVMTRLAGAQLDSVRAWGPLSLHVGYGGGGGLVDPASEIRGLDQWALDVWEYHVIARRGADAEGVAPGGPTHFFYSPGVGVSSSAAGTNAAGGQGGLSVTDGARSPWAGHGPAGNDSSPTQLGRSGARGYGYGAGGGGEGGQTVGAGGGGGGGWGALLPVTTRFGSEGCIQITEYRGVVL